VERAGRNDPCPCGSGKKYKNCCLGRDRTSRILASSWRSDEQGTLEKLIAFAQRPALSSQLGAAFNLFWNGIYGFEGLNALDRAEVGRFMDWYIHDFRLEGSSQRIIDLFVDEAGPSLLTAERERTRSWQTSHLGLYRIATEAEDGLLTVTDVLQGTQTRLWDNGMGRLGLPGDLILARVLHSSEPAHFSWAAVLLPAVMEDPLRQFIQTGYQSYRETHSEASWAQFLSVSGYMFNHYLLRSAAEAAQARQHRGAYYDAFPTLEKLREVETRLRELAARQARERSKAKQAPAEEKGEALRQTKGGILLPGHVQYKGSKEVD